jgi:hypothetical protein
MEDSDESKNNFFKHVFKMDDITKTQLLNNSQYAILSIIPIILLNKLMSLYVPEPVESKGTVEIIAEIVIQILVIVLGLFYTDRIITFIPTYSGEEYPKTHVIYMFLGILMILFSINSKLGEKVNIITDRIIELWEGRSKKQDTSSSSEMKISQPIAGRIHNPLPPSIAPAQPNNTANASSYSDGTAISSLPQVNFSPPPKNQSAQQQQLPNYNNFYEKDNTPLVNASSPTESFEGPVAANSVMGGSFGSSW